MGGNKWEDEDLHDSVVNFDITNQIIDKLSEACGEVYQNRRFE